MADRDRAAADPWSPPAGRPDDVDLTDQPERYLLSAFGFLQQRASIDAGTETSEGSEEPEPQQQAELQDKVA